MRRMLGSKYDENASEIARDRWSSCIEVSKSQLLVSSTTSPAAQLTALVGCGYPFALSKNFLAMAIGDWISLEAHTTSTTSTSTEGSGTSVMQDEEHQNPFDELGNVVNNPHGGTHNATHGGATPGVLMIGSEVLALETHGSLLAVLCEKFIRLYEVDVSAPGTQRGTHGRRGTDGSVSGTLNYTLVRAFI